MTPSQIRLAIIIGCGVFWIAVWVGIAHAEVPVLLPPPEFDHKPLRPVPEIFLPWAEVDQYCRERGVQWQSRAEGGRILECAVRDGGWYDCVFMEGLDEGYLNQWRRHCWGHVNNWPADHPDAHYE